MSPLAYVPLSVYSKVATEKWTLVNGCMSVQTRKVWTLSLMLRGRGRGRGGGLEGGREGGRERGLEREE